MTEETATLTDVLEEWFNQGVQQLLAGKWIEAESIYRRILAERPNVPDVHYNLGIALIGQGKQEEALDVSRRALALRPNFSDACTNLSTTLRDTHRPTQAVEVCKQALTALDRDYAQAWNNMAVALKDTGQLDEALAAFDRGIALQPEAAGMYSNRLFTLLFHPAYDDARIFGETKQWNDRFARPLQGEVSSYDNERTTDRRLRIGYVSPDFRTHCQALFMTPLLSWHDHGDFEIFFATASAPATDPVTTRLKGLADVWRDIAGLDDVSVSQLIRHDKIDILVDLTMHMTGSRLLFARKPAPVQATWLGYPGTTGVEAIDYRLTDPRLDPPKNGQDGKSAPGDEKASFAPKLENYAERSVRLPDTFWCYDPSGMTATTGANLPEPGPLPVLITGRITFGCLNNFCKVSDRTLALWARVMEAVPNSQLILLSPTGPHREQVVQKLGVTSDRVQFVTYQPRLPYLETYRRIDLCLDTLPYNGHTTSLDALWMGVPVVTLVGQTIAGRAGWSQLHNLGLLDLVAQTEDQFVKVAVDLAGDLERLNGLRTTMRERMEQSPLMDGPRFAGGMENAFRQMWQAWCGENH